MRRLTSQRGFTLIELLVVMAIIATLASLGVVGLPALFRRNDQIKCKDNLTQIYQQLVAYQTDHKSLPTADGPAFVLGVWGRPYFDKQIKEAEMFFCPSTRHKPDADLGNVTPEGIDFTGPEQHDKQAGRRNGLATYEEGASNTVIVANKCPDPQQVTSLEDRRRLLPHSGTGIVVLYLNGGTDFISATEFPDELPVVGRDSALDKLKWLRSGLDG